MYRRSLLSDRHSTRFLPSRKRPAGTPPSTFLFLLIYFSNSPGPMKVPSPETGEPSKQASDRVGCLSHREVVWSFRGAPSRRCASARRRTDIYGQPRTIVNTSENEKIARKCPTGCPVVQYLVGFSPNARCRTRSQTRRSEATFLSRSDQTRTNAFGGSPAG